MKHKWEPIGSIDRHRIRLNDGYEIILDHYIKSEGNFCTWEIRRYFDLIDSGNSYGLEKCKLMAINQLDKIRK